MFRTANRDWPDLNVRVIGILECDGGYDELGWWTRTDDGWCVSDDRGQIGHRDTMTKEDSRGPTLWMHAPPKPMNK